MHARDYALEAHADQRYGADLYLVHLAGVVEVLDDAGVLSPLVESVAWLHDVLEDTDRSYADLEDAFGDDVADAVALVTDPEGSNRKSRKAALHARLADLEASNPVHRAALLVKLADRVANVEASIDDPKRLKMYRREHAAFSVAVYRGGLALPLVERLERAIFGIGPISTEPAPEPRVLGQLPPNWHESESK